MYDCNFDLYDKNFRYLGSVYCPLENIRDKYKDAKYYMTYKYVTNTRDHFVDIDNPMNWIYPENVCSDKH
jgi:hypothetical protein